MSHVWLLFPATDESPVSSPRFGYSRSSWEPDVFLASVERRGRRIERSARIAAPVRPCRRTSWRLRSVITATGTRRALRLTIKRCLARSVPFASRSITFLPFQIAYSVALPIDHLARQHCFLTSVSWPQAGIGRTKQGRVRRRRSEKPAPCVEVVPTVPIVIACKSVAGTVNPIFDLDA